MKTTKSLLGSLTILAAGIMTISLMAGCTREKKADYGLKLDETFRVNLSTEPPSLDWSKATDTTSSHVINNIMSGLAEYDLGDPELAAKPALAESWSAADNAKTWTIKLKKGVKWTDGTEFTAQNVIDAWERLLNPATASEYAYALFNIANAKEYNEKKVTDFAQVGVKSTDSHTLVISLKTGVAFFPYLLTHHSTFPLRKDIVTKFGDKWTDPANIQTLGAFKLAKWDHDKAIVLERNEAYWGEKPKIKNVLGYMVNEESTALNLFDSGKLDVQDSLPSTEMDSLRKRPEYSENSRLLMYYYGFNTKKAPFDNPLIRRAFASAINKDELVKMLNGGQKKLNGWIPHGMAGHEASRGLDFNVEKAKEFLKQAGITDPKKLGKITIGFNTNADHKRVAENIQTQLKKNLGVEVELKNEEWKVYLNTLKVDPPNIYRMGWLADYPDPDNFMNLMTSYSENNRTKWGNKDYDKLVEQAVSELDKTKRMSLYSQAQKILTEDEVPAIPLYSGTAHYLVNKRVAGFPFNALDVKDYRKVEIKK